MAEFELDEFLTRLRIPEGSEAIGHGVDVLHDHIGTGARVLQLRRNGETFLAADTDQRLEAGDILVVHGTRPEADAFRDAHDLRRLGGRRVADQTLDDDATEGVLDKAVVPETSTFVGETIAETRLQAVYDTTVLAVRREGELIRTGFDDIAVAIMAGVVGAAALGILPIVIAALGGVFAMVVTGCLTPSDAYDAVSWNVIFLLAGVIPLGLAMEQTGGATLIAQGLVATGSILPIVAVLLLFTLVTGLLANVITPVATVVLMIPVAVDAAAQIGANEFSFLLAVMFASATSFSTPVGYQTNLMVYGPGGYEFTDFLRVGGPLQILLALVTTAGIFLIWGL